MPALLVAPESMVHKQPHHTNYEEMPTRSSLFAQTNIIHNTCFLSLPAISRTNHYQGAGSAIKFWNTVEGAVESRHKGPLNKDLAQVQCG